MRARFAVPALIVIVLSTVTGGCIPSTDRQRQAETIAGSVRAMPGVESVQPHYVNAVDAGASFDLTVAAQRTISAAAVADVGRRVVTQVDHVGFPEHVVSLAVTFPQLGSGFDDNRSIASFFLTDERGVRRKDVTADRVAADLQFWLEVVNFPGVELVDLRRPAQQNSRDGGGRTIDVHVADNNVGSALETRYPELRKHWSL